MAQLSDARSKTRTRLDGRITVGTAAPPALGKLSASSSSLGSSGSHMAGSNLNNKKESHHPAPRADRWGAAGVGKPASSHDRHSSLSTRHSPFAVQHRDHVRRQRIHLPNLPRRNLHWAACQWCQWCQCYPESARSEKKSPPSYGRALPRPWTLLDGGSQGIHHK